MDSSHGWLGELKNVIACPEAGDQVAFQGKNRTKPRVLIGTLYCGENEFEQSKEALARQTYREWDHVVFRDLENKEAHNALYRCFMSNRNEFDMFMKLDADMVFRSPHSLEKIVDVFRFTPNLDHLRSLVLDWYSGLLIPALHVFSNRVRWVEDPKEQMFVDAFPEVPGIRISLHGSPAPFVDHSPNPTAEQGFWFGVHRASKAVQSEREVFHRGQGVSQWRLLKAVWKRFKETGDPRLGLCMYGAELVFRGELFHSDYVAGKTHATKLRASLTDEILEMLEKEWSSPVRRELRYYRMISFRYCKSFLVAPLSVKGIMKRLGLIT